MLSLPACDRLFRRAPQDVEEVPTENTGIELEGSEPRRIKGIEKEMKPCEKCNKSPGNEIRCDEWWSCFQLRDYNIERRLKNERQDITPQPPEPTHLKFYSLVSIRKGGATQNLALPPPQTR